MARVQADNLLAGHRVVIAPWGVRLLSFPATWLGRVTISGDVLRGGRYELQPTLLGRLLGMRHRRGRWAV